LSEPDRNGISAKLWRLPGEFLLALINATAILAIVAAILALVAIVRIDNFAGNVVATMTEAALSKIDLPSKDVLENLQNLTKEVRALGNALREFKAGENPVLQSEIARLKEAVTALNVSVDRLTNARTILTDEAIGDQVDDEIELGRLLDWKVSWFRPAQNLVDVLFHRPRSEI
jgi:septal ring factor EnvC (AmiA/AmiB activator)